MALTFVDAAVHDPASGNAVPVEGVLGVGALSNPTGTNSVRQTVVLMDGSANGSTNASVIDADNNLHVVQGRVSTGAVTNVPAATSATLLLAARATRVSVIVNNQSSSNMYIGLASSITAGPQGTGILWVVPGGQTWIVPPGFAYTGTLYGIWDGTDGGANIGDF